MKGERFGAFPYNWTEAREKGIFKKINNENSMRIVSGENSPVLLRFIASSDVLQMGELTIPAGGVGPRQTEYDRHAGDVVFYVRQGTLTFLLKDSGDVFEVEEKEYMFIPENTEYKCINYSDSVIKTIFLAAPEL